MKFKIGQQVKSAFNSNRFIVLGEVSRMKVRVQHINARGPSDLVYVVAKSSFIVERSHD